MSKSVKVSGYYRSNGTYVSGYTRSAPTARSSGESSSSKSTGSAVSSSTSSSGVVHVSGYTRSNGTYVQPHTRSTPTRKSDGASSSTSSSGVVHVSGYTRSNGTYVQPHTRSTPTRKSVCASSSTSSSGGSCSNGTYVQPHTRSAPMSRSASNTASKVAAKQYVGNHKRGRVGMPLGTMPSGGKRYVDNPHNRRIGRSGKLIPPRNVRQQEIMEGNTVQDIIRFMEDMAVGIEYDIYQSAARRLAQQQVEEEWRKKNISFEPPALAIQKIPYQDLKTENEIGNGGFGTVFACLWNEKPVAYKKFIQQQMSRRAHRDFAKEMKILVSLDHPCIVRLFGAVLEERCIGIVMEYMSRTLFQALFNDESEFEDEKKKKIVSQLASALQYLHTPPTEISHCDIKSQNVLLDKDDNAKLSDFGLSVIKKNTEASRSTAAPVPARGTPRYSAPEVLRGELLTQQQFSKADIYSLAICVFETVTEEEAYYGLGEKQLEAQVGRGNLRPKAESDVAFSAELSAFLESCWDSTAENRPTSTQIVDQWSKITDLLIHEQKNFSLVDLEL